MAQRVRADSPQSRELTRAKIRFLIHASIINPGTGSKVKLYWGRRSHKEHSVPTLHGAEPVLKEGPLLNRDLRVAPDVARSFIEELL